MSGYVYFITTYGEDCPARCKIGFTSGRPNDRLNSLQCGSPIKLKFYCAFVGTMDTERDLHNIFREYRIHGEWFSVEGRLLSFLSSLVREVDSGNIFSAARLRDLIQERARPALAGIE